MFENLALVQIIDNCTSASIIAIIQSLLAKIQIFELFDWLKFFEGNSRCNSFLIGPLIQNTTS
jgi:hypothetical protein